MTPDEILHYLVDAGSIDTAAVKALEHQLESDWVVTADEAELLFRINDAVGQRDENCPTWNELYVHSISRYVLFDMNTPGEICPEEAEWLRAHMQSSGTYTKADRELLTYIRERATRCCESMEELFNAAGI